MIMTNKVTKEMQFNAIKAILDEKGEAELSAFIDSEIALVRKKNARRSTKPTKNQLANIELMDKIYETMESDKQYRVSEIGKFDFLNDFTINKVNALVRGLKLNGRVVKSEAKGIAYFTKA